MGFLMMFVVFIVIGLCAAKGKGQRRAFLSGVLALLYLPIGILLSLVKNYK